MRPKILKYRSRLKTTIDFADTKWYNGPGLSEVRSCKQKLSKAHIMLEAKIFPACKRIHCIRDFFRTKILTWYSKNIVLKVKCVFLFYGAADFFHELPWIVHMRQIYIFRVHCSSHFWYPLINSLLYRFFVYLVVKLKGIVLFSIGSRMTITNIYL